MRWFLSLIKSDHPEYRLKCVWAKELFKCTSTKNIMLVKKRFMHVSSLERNVNFICRWGITPWWASMNQILQLPKNKKIIILKSTLLKQKLLENFYRDFDAIISIQWLEERIGMGIRTTVLVTLLIFKCVLKKFGNVLFTLKVLNGLYENYFPRTSSSLQKSYSEQNAMTFLKSWEIKMCTLNISKTTMKHVTIAL